MEQPHLMHEYDYATTAFSHQDLLCVAPTCIHTRRCPAGKAGQQVQSYGLDPCWVYKGKESCAAAAGTHAPPE